MSQQAIFNGILRVTVKVLNSYDVKFYVVRQDKNMSENINEIAGVEPSFKIDELKFNEKGLIPAIVQDHYSKKVLMMAWMNRESLEISLREKKTCFYSRSRQELWRKGETSGNVQHIE